MSTNYYKVRKLSRKEKDEIIDAIENDRLNSVEYIDNDGVEQGIDKNEIYIHIGKTAAGWKFDFDHNNWKYFGKNRKEIEDFINDPSMPLIDEYGRPITPERLWELVANSETYIEDDGTVHEAWDMQSYEKWEKEENGNPSYNAYGHYDIYIDGLRFSDTTGWS